MIELSQLYLFAIAALVLLLIPGPAVLYITARSASQGRMAGLVSVLAIETANFAQAVAAALPYKDMLDAAIYGRGAPLFGGSWAGTPPTLDFPQALPLKESGSLFSAYAIWPRAALTYAGTVSMFAGRSFCPHCGGRLFCLTEEKAELRLGSLDGPPVGIEPAQEVWIIRRERWLHPVAGAVQFQGDPV